MTLLLNILWFILGGFISGMLWMLAGLVLAVTVVGLPWAFAAWRIGGFAFAPFGRQVFSRREDAFDLGTGDPGLVLNVVWLVFAGWWLALGHVLIGAAQVVTIIGIPFGLQHFKLALLALAPVGKTIEPMRNWG